MSTWEYIISYPIEEVHYGRNRSHYRCASEGLQLQHMDMNAHPCKCIRIHCIRMQSCWFMSAWLWWWREKYVDTFQSCWAQRQVGRVKGFSASLNSPFPCIRLLRTRRKARFEKPGRMQSVPLHFPWRSDPLSSNTRTLWWISVSEDEVRELRMKCLDSTRILTLNFSLSLSP